MEGYQWGRGGENGRKIQGIRSVNGRYKIDRGEGKNSTGKGEAKELIYMTHGHELRWGNDGGRGLQDRGKQRGEKNGTTAIA